MIRRVRVPLFASDCPSARAPQGSTSGGAALGCPRVRYDNDNDETNDNDKDNANDNDNDK